MKTVIQPAGGSTEISARPLSVIKEDIVKCQENNAQSYLAIGNLLLEAKVQFGKHGDWLEWLDKNVDMSVTKAQRLMRVAKKFSNTAPVPYLDYTKAYILTALPECEIEQFLKDFHHVEGNYAKSVKQMTRRELEFAVRKHLKEKREKRGSSAAAQLPQSANVVADTNDSQDAFHTHCDKIRTSLKKLANIIDEQGEDFDSRESLIAELRELCNEIIQKFPNEEL